MKDNPHKPTGLPSKIENDPKVLKAKLENPKSLNEVLWSRGCGKGRDAKTQVVTNQDSIGVCGEL